MKYLLSKEEQKQAKEWRKKKCGSIYKEDMIDAFKLHLEKRKL